MKLYLYLNSLFVFHKSFSHFIEIYENEKTEEAVGSSWLPPSNPAITFLAFLSPLYLYFVFGLVYRKERHGWTGGS